MVFIYLVETSKMRDGSFKISQMTEGTMDSHQEKSLV